MRGNRRLYRSAASLYVLAGMLFWSAAGSAETVTLKSGAKYDGNVMRIANVGESPFIPSGEIERKPVVTIDDDLRITYVPYHQASGFTESPPKNLERIKINQLVASTGKRIIAVGDYVNITPFDDFGRRVYTMRGTTGLMNIFQGITEITPVYSKIEGLRGVESPCVWDLRMATSSIPAATLRKVLLHAEGADPKNADARLRVVRLFIQAEMYREALAELESVLKDFADLAHLKDQQTRLVQLLAQQLLRDIELRRDAGQHQRVLALLQNFPNQDVAAETLLRVRDMLKEYDDQKQQYDRAVAMFDQRLGEIKAPQLKAKLTALGDEMKQELNIHTLNRMADFLRLGDDEKLPADQRMALALSGWLLGSGSGIENLGVAMSLVEMRDLVLKYLRCEVEPERLEILSKIRALEGSSPAFLAKLIANLKPPIETQTDAAVVPGLYERKIRGIEEQPEFTYLVQLPPEYDPWKRYPCIVTLNGGGSTELQQISWWAGDYLEKSSMRVGQASRRGYVVIAPRWQRPLQAGYEYTLREHAAVMFALRDACQRISIDTDRVFLSGHYTGGDAAWDIALAHPDLWAGCIMFAPRADRYVKFYRDNARMIPLYFVGGDKDVGSSEEGNWLTENQPELDRYLADTKTDCTMVLYRGRGRDREGFSDEVTRIFEWMSLPGHRRNFAPTRFEVVSLRPWDNYFWWLECDDFPANATVLPHAWPQAGARAAETKAEIVAKTGRINVNPSSDRLTIWLSPEIADFEKTIRVAVSGRELKEPIKPSIDVILEDVRTRGDRQHPFWAQVEWPERKKR